MDEGDNGQPDNGMGGGQGANIPEPEINNYDIDDDFPEYANEQNKELNQIVSPLNLISTRSEKKSNWFTNSTSRLKSTLTDLKFSKSI